MGSLAEKIYMDLMARGKDISIARYIGKYLHTQSYHVREYIMSAGYENSVVIRKEQGEQELLF